MSPYYTRQENQEVSIHRTRTNQHQPYSGRQENQ